VDLVCCLSLIRSATTPYAKQNGGSFNFVFDIFVALPDDQVTERILICMTTVFSDLVESTEEKSESIRLESKSESQGFESENSEEFNEQGWITRYHGLCDSNKLLYKRCAKSMEKPKFRPPQLPHFQPILMKLETKKDIRDTTPHAKFG